MAPAPSSPRPRRRLGTAAAVVLALGATVLLLLWLSVSRPALWLPLLNRQLPEGLDITAAEGVRPGLSGIAWHRIELERNEQRFRLEQGHARWTLERLRPLDVRLLHFETEHLLAILAPPNEASPAAWEPLPRFWEAPWWSALAGSSGHVQGFDVLDHGGETLLSGSLQWQQGAHSGEAGLFVADTEVAVSWAPERDGVTGPGWAVLWHSHGSPLGPVHAEGEGQLRWDGDRLDFQIQGELHGELIAAISTDLLAMGMGGELDLFTSADRLLTADWELHGHHDGFEELPVAWGCDGRVALHHTLTPAPQLDRCELVSAFGTALLSGPVALDWQPLAVRWDQPLELTLSGSLMEARLVAASHTCALAEACDWPLLVTVGEGSHNGLAWGSATVAAHLHRSAANGLQVTDLEARLTRLQQDDLIVRDLQVSVPAMAVWPPGDGSRASGRATNGAGSHPFRWHVARLDVGAHIELAGADPADTGLALTVHGSLTDLYLSTLSRWSTRLDLALDPVWQRHDFPTFHLKQQWQQTPQHLQASGTLLTAALDPLLEHQISLTPDDAGQHTAQFTAELDTSRWPAETDIGAAVQGDDGTLLPVRALHGDVRARINGSWRDHQWLVGLTGQAGPLAGRVGQYAFAGAEVAPFALSWRAEGLDTADPLRWRVQEFNIGVVLTGLEGQLALQQNRWRLADVRGELLGGHFHLDAFSAAEGGHLRLDHLDLAAAVALMNQPDIRVSGLLEGDLPIALDDGKPIIRAGTLRNIGPGTIHYRPAPGSDFLRNNPQTAVVGDVLDNFHYQRLEAGVTYRADGDLLLATRLEGRNPDLEGSPPVHLNLNVEQNIPALMRSLRAGDDIGAWLERRINAR